MRKSGVVLVLAVLACAAWVLAMRRRRREAVAVEEPFQLRGRLNDLANRIFSSFPKKAVEQEMAASGTGEPGSKTLKRPCTVYFTDMIDTCDKGDFAKSWYYYEKAVHALQAKAKRTPLTPAEQQALAAHTKMLAEYDKFPYRRHCKVTFPSWYQQFEKTEMPATFGPHALNAERGPPEDWAFCFRKFNTLDDKWLKNTMLDVVKNADNPIPRTFSVAGDPGYVRGTFPTFDATEIVHGVCRENPQSHPKMPDVLGFDVDTDTLQLTITHAYAMGVHIPLNRDIGVDQLNWKQKLALYQLAFRLRAHGREVLQTHFDRASTITQHVKDRLARLGVSIDPARKQLLYFAPRAFDKPILRVEKGTCDERVFLPTTNTFRFQLRENTFLKMAPFSLAYLLGNSLQLAATWGVYEIAIRKTTKKYNKTVREDIPKTILRIIITSIQLTIAIVQMIITQIQMWFNPFAAAGLAGRLAKCIKDIVTHARNLVIHRAKLTRLQIQAIMLRILLAILNYIQSMVTKFIMLVLENYAYSIFDQLRLRKFDLTGTLQPENMSFNRSVYLTLY